MERFEQEPQDNRMVAYGAYVGTVDEMLQACPFMRGFEDQPDMLEAVTQEGVENYQRLDPEEAERLHAETLSKIAPPAEPERPERSPEKVTPELSRTTAAAEQKTPKPVSVAETVAPKALTPELTHPETVSPPPPATRLEEIVADGMVSEAVHRREDAEDILRIERSEAPELLPDPNIIAEDDQGSPVTPYRATEQEVVEPLPPVSVGVEAPAGHANIADDAQTLPEAVLEPADGTVTESIRTPLPEEAFANIEPEPDTVPRERFENEALDELSPAVAATEAVTADAEALSPVLHELSEAAADFEQTAAPEQAEQLHELLAESMQIAELLAGLPEPGDDSEDIEVRLAALDVGDPAGGETIGHVPLTGMSEARIVERLTVVCEQVLTMLDMPHDETSVRLLVTELLEQARRIERPQNALDLSVEELERWGMHNYKLRFGHVDDAADDSSGVHIRRIGAFALAA